ncbi:MAG: glycerate kinase [Alkalicoccus sp.]|nr:MAG: glycerate kinase [Alkalicoccus sp.]
MKIVIASDSFKETLSSLEAGKAAERGIKKVLPSAETVVCPMADGGEGTVTALVDAWKGEYIYAEVNGPIGLKTKARYGISDDGETAVIEMAAASGIHLVPKQDQDVKKASTFGTGELILHALDRGVRSFVIGIGGSATNDGGKGMLQALGVSFTDSSGRELPGGGAPLLYLHHICPEKMDPRLKQASFRVACDVDNPLTGARGASAVYGPQKGASTEDTALLDKALGNYAAVVKKLFSLDIDTPPGAGAAGGLGAGFLGFLPVTMEKGAEIIADMTGLREHLHDADFVITGEGGINEQTIHGKTPVYVASLTKNINPVPVIALCGTVTSGYETVFGSGIDAVFSTLSEAGPLDQLKKSAPSHVEQTAENVARLLNCTGYFSDFL